MVKLIKYLIVFFLIAKNVGALENKIILKVNNDVITTLDIFSEINNLKFFNMNLNKVDDDEIYEIALQSILKSKIKKNETDRVFVNDKPINNNYLNSLIETQYKKLGFKNLIDFKKELDSQNIDFENFEEKLKIEILWNQIIYSKFFEKVVINEDEIRKQIENEKNIIVSYDLSEIIFEVTNLNELNLNYELIKKDINEIGFENTALKYSISETSNNGGNLGWIDENQLNKKIIKELNIINNGSITKPIRIPSGFLILKKKDTKEIKKNKDIEVELKKQIDFQKNAQLDNYSNIYFNKIRKDLKINAP
ncbi:peptidylprolyl isomerase [Candidatus Pelagibacter sp.]|uniref:peptidylprolyl isomerase n=1 Tax=Candidatus Pelagibacter sp. TaxID=2024849 RepID=UPI003F87E095